MIQKNTSDDFRNFKTTFRKRVLVPSQTDTRNIYSKICRNKYRKLLFSLFFQCWPVISLQRNIQDDSPKIVDEEIL